MRHVTYLTAELFEKGIGHVVVVRHKSAGRYEAGVFLVDVWCLGVKDAFFTTSAQEPNLDNLLQQIFREDPMAEREGAYGRKLVEAAVAYAKNLGLAPHRDYAKGARVFGGCNPLDCDEEFVFGKDGRPFFIQGPLLDSEAAARVLRLLTARLGEDGFEYMVEAPFVDCDEEEEEDATGFLTIIPSESGERFLDATKPGKLLAKMLDDFIEEAQQDSTECEVCECINLLADRLTFFLPADATANPDFLTVAFAPVVVVWNFLNSGMPLDEYREMCPPTALLILDSITKEAGYAELLELLEPYPWKNFRIHQFRVVADPSEECGCRLLVIASLTGDVGEAGDNEHEKHTN